MIVNLAIDLFWALVLIFSVCDFGERLCGKLEEIGHVYDQSSWYAFPYNVQRMLSTLIMIAQQPVELQVFGSISCGRITFRSVSKITIETPQFKMN